MTMNFTMLLKHARGKEFFYKEPIPHVYHIKLKGVTGYRICYGALEAVNYLENHFKPKES